MAVQAIQQPTTDNQQRKQSIFDIGDELNQIAIAFDQLEAGGTEQEVLDALEKYFGDLLDRRDEKIDHYCGLKAQWDAEAEICENEAKRLMARAKAARNRSDRLKTRLHDFMKLHGIEHIKTALHTARRQANGGSLPVQIEVVADQLPQEYQRVTVLADTEAIRKALLSGFELEGCKLGERGEHLRIE